MQPTPMSCHKYTSIQLLNNPKDLQLEKSNIMKRNPTSEKDGICSNFYYFSIISNFCHKDQGRTRKTMTKLNDKGHFSLLGFCTVIPSKPFFPH